MSSVGHCLEADGVTRKSHQESSITPIEPNHILEGLWVGVKVIVTVKLQSRVTDTSGKQPHIGRGETCEAGTQHKCHIRPSMP